VTADDAVELSRLNVKVKVMVLEGSPIHQNLVEFQGDTLELFPLAYRPRDFFDFQLKKDLHAQISSGVNVIHAHQPTLVGTISPWLWNAQNVSFFLSRHILSSHGKKDPIHALLYKRVDRLVVMSEAMKENVLRTHPLPEEKVELIRLGLDFDRFDPEKVDAKRQRALWGADEETIVIGLVGRIDPAKGQSTLLQAGAGLMQKLNNHVKVKFVIVGEETLGQTSSYLQELKEMVTQFQLTESVVFAGFQKNIPEVMQAFDLFVMPSKQEAFGLVAIEAMAMECPIVISSGGSSLEIVGKEEYGLLIRPQDAFDLQRQLLVLIEKESLRREMGIKARKQVMSLYDRKERTKKTLALYERGFLSRSAR
jgi:glycosyltransferase involved in cell wall biosynthesis